MWLSFGLSWQMSCRSVLRLRRLALLGNLYSSKQRPLGLLEDVSSDIFRWHRRKRMNMSVCTCSLRRTLTVAPSVACERATLPWEQLFRRHETTLHLRRRFLAQLTCKCVSWRYTVHFCGHFTHWIIGFEVKHKLTTHCLWVALLAHFHAPCVCSLQRLTLSSAN